VGQIEEEISSPEHLNATHDVAQFQCGEPTLDDWLKSRAHANEESGASRTYVICKSGRVVGYYALAVGAVEHENATGRVRRNMPNPVPVMVIGRLAVDVSLQGQRVGAALLKDAILKTLRAAEIGGVRAVLVHAISVSAKKFYERLGFLPSPNEPMTLMVPLSEAAKRLGQK
jgi:predicted N-acetyltransferase YhbS